MFQHLILDYVKVFIHLLEILTSVLVYAADYENTKMMTKFDNLNSYWSWGGGHLTTLTVLHFSGALDPICGDSPHQSYDTSRS